LSHGIEVFVVYKLDGDLLRHIAGFLLRFAGRDDRPDGFLHFFERTGATFLLFVDFDDVNTELRLNQIADCSGAQAEGNLLEFRNHLTTSE